MSSKSNGKVSLETRARLISALGSPPGIVVVRRNADHGDQIEVILPADGSLPTDSRLDEFEGFRVRYRVGATARGGRW